MQKTPQVHQAVACVKKGRQIRLQHRGGGPLLGLQQTALFGECQFAHERRKPIKGQQRVKNITSSLECIPVFLIRPPLCWSTTCGNSWGHKDRKSYTWGQLT